MNLRPFNNLIIFFVGLCGLINTGFANQYSFKDENLHLVRLLNKGSSSFYERIDLIKKAQKSIVMEYFIFNDDTIGRIFIHELIKKVKAGVEVKILVDNFSVEAQLTAHHSAELLKKGIEIKYYNPLPFSSVIKTNYRNHRKLFIIDNEQYIVGGRNIGDDYFDLSERYNFIDRDILISGSSGSKTRKTFDQFFHSKHSKIKYRPSMPTLNQLEFLRGSQTERAKMLQVVRAKKRIWSERKEKGKKFLKLTKDDKKKFQALYSIGKKTIEMEYKGEIKNIEFTSDPPVIGPENDQKRLTRDSVSGYLTNAQEIILIDSPYFILDKNLEKDLNNILEKNIKVELMTNGIYSTDALPVAAVFNHYLTNWLEKGLVPTVYGGEKILSSEYYISPEVADSRWGTHAKSITIDHKDSIIGSFNFDPRSVNYSAELMVKIENNPELAAAMEENFYFRKSMSKTFLNVEDAKKHEFDNVTMFKRMGYYLIKPFSLLIQSFL